MASLISIELDGEDSIVYCTPLMPNAAGHGPDRLEGWCELSTLRMASTSSDVSAWSGLLRRGAWRGLRQCRLQVPGRAGRLRLGRIEYRGLVALRRLEAGTHEVGVGIARQLLVLGLLSAGLEHLLAGFAGLHRLNKANTGHYEENSFHTNAIFSYRSRFRKTMTISIAASSAKKAMRKGPYTCRKRRQCAGD